MTHGTKMASLVLAVAPQARILDLALLPSHILNLSGAAGFLSWAVAVYWTLVATITWLKLLFPRLQRAMGPEQFLGRVRPLDGFPPGRLP